MTYFVRLSMITYSHLYIQDVRELLRQSLILYLQTKKYTRISTSFWKYKTKFQNCKNEAYVGRVEKVLVDGVSKNDETTLSGRCDSSKIVNFKGDKSLIGKYIDVKITEAHTWSLNGEIAE